MASVTQKIPNYVAGISEQPDELKFPGQTRDLLNCFPDVTRQLIKRPGSRFNQDVVNGTDIEWFSYYRDLNEQYIGGIKQNGELSIYNVVNVSNVSQPVFYTGNSQQYMNWTEKEQIQTLTVNDISFVTNRNIYPKMLDESTGTVSIDCFANEFPGSSAIALGDYTNVATTNVTGTGNGLTIDFTVDGIEDPDNPGTYLVKYLTDVVINTPGTGYKNGDIFQPVGADYTTIGIVYLNSNKSKPDIPEAYVEIKIAAYGREYYFNVYNEDGTLDVAIQIDSEEDPTQVLKITDILDAWLTQLRAAGYAAKIIGNGIYFTRPEKFNIDIIDTQTMNGFADDVNSFDRLPFQCHDGMLVKVANTDSTDEDDFYVVFNGDNGNDGVGIWEETVAPDLYIKFDPDTLPHEIRSAPNSITGIIEFTVSPITWAPLGAGNYDTNPPPAFINYETGDPESVLLDGQRINKLLLFRNRLCFLSGENVSTTQAGGFGDVTYLFSDSVLSLSPLDPIVVAASSNRPAILYDGVEINNGLVLFGETQQYLLSNDDSTLGLTQETVKLSSIGNYLFNKDIKPVMMGTTVGFTNLGGNSFRLYEMARIDLQGQPTATELSKVVSQLLPDNLISMADSMEGNLLMFANEEAGRENEVWGFRYFTVGEERRQSAWFRWTLPGKVLYHTIMRDTYYAVCELTDGTITQNKIFAFDIKRTDETALVDDKYLVHLDSKVQVSGSDVTYNANLNSSEFPLTYSYPDPVNPNNTITKNVFTNTDNVFAFSLDDGNYRPVTFTDNNKRGIAEGDWSQGDFIVGYLYDMKVAIPTFYVVDQRAGSNVAVKADTRASLVIHRFNIEAGATGIFDVTLQRLGYPDYVETYYPAIMNSYLANEPMIEPALTRTIPCYIRNKQLDVILHSEHPSPFTLFSISWEGDFSDKYYRSV